MTRPVLVLAAALLLPYAARAAGDAVGPDTCKACHAAAWEVWRASPHARALEALPEKSRKDPRCLSCHSPQSEDGLAGVTCEACHGGGRAYSARYVMRDPELARLVGLADPGEKTCLGCHTDWTPSLEKFDYAKKLAPIIHGATARPPLQAPPSPPPAPARKER